MIGFLTLVDLFATQAILPSLAQSYGATPAQIGLAANASTLGMAISGLLVGVFSANIERKRAIALSLLALSVPTAALAFAPNLTVFAILRVVQGLFMAAAFTLTLTHLAERCAVRTAHALAARARRRFARRVAMRRRNSSTQSEGGALRCSGIGGARVRDAFGPSVEVVDMVANIAAVAPEAGVPR